VELLRLQEEAAAAAKKAAASDAAAEVLERERVTLAARAEAFEVELKELNAAVRRLFAGCAVRVVMGSVLFQLSLSCNLTNVYSYKMRAS
jgi:hypothetical protein